jgi:hypothetical protein
MNQLITVGNNLPKNTIRYILTVLTVPFIYILLVPAMMLDFLATIYQSLCFPIYGILPVHRQSYMRLDRNRLLKLDRIQKINCQYCGYFNGVLAYVQEIASRTEQYWCPIHHEKDAPFTHARYKSFADFNPNKDYTREFELFRSELNRELRRRRRALEIR